jgi:UDP-glucose 4-epimerase/UDP-glucuronate decarboxylase
MSEVTQRRILVTGGAGFIGYHLATELAREAGNHVVLVDNFVRGRLDADLEKLVAMPNVQLLSADLTDPASFGKFGSGYDEVYHLAAILGVGNVLERPHEVLRVNAITTLLLLDWFVQGGGKKVLFSSTSEVYAWTQQFYPLPVPTPEDVPLALTDLRNRRSSYAGSKIFGELAVAQYCGVHERPFVTVRYHNVYGPRMGYDHVIPQLYRRICQGEQPLVVYSADHRRAFCYVSDAVCATIQAMRSDRATGAVVNIGNDLEELTIRELAERLLRKANREVAIAPRPQVNDPVVRRAPDISRARDLFDYQPRVSLDEGLDRTIAWYRRSR